MATDNGDPGMEGRRESAPSFSRFSIGLAADAVSGQPSPQAFQTLLNESNALADRYEERLNNQKAIIDRQKVKILECQGILVQQDEFLRQLFLQVDTGQVVLDVELLARLKEMLGIDESS